jgi:hypothetical protein
MADLTWLKKMRSPMLRATATCIACGDETDGLVQSSEGTLVDWHFPDGWTLLEPMGVVCPRADCRAAQVVQRRLGHPATIMSKDTWVTVAAEYLAARFPLLAPSSMNANLEQQLAELFDRAADPSGAGQLARIIREWVRTAAAHRIGLKPADVTTPPGA